MERSKIAGDGRRAATIREESSLLYSPWGGAKVTATTSRLVPFCTSTFQLAHRPEPKPCPNPSAMGTATVTCPCGGTGGGDGVLVGTGIFRWCFLDTSTAWVVVVGAVVFVVAVVRTAIGDAGTVMITAGWAMTGLGRVTARTVAVLIEAPSRADPAMRTHAGVAGILGLLGCA
jgi:hypothetical protein